MKEGSEQSLKLILYEKGNSPSYGDFKSEYDFRLKREHFSNEFVQGRKRTFVDPFAPKLDYTVIRGSRVDIPRPLIRFYDNLEALENCEARGELPEEWQNHLAMYRFFYPSRPAEAIELW